MTPQPDRLASLDQFRGYTVLGMFLVNFVGGRDHVADVLKHHHTYCSYADTIMPQFLLAVGFGMRLSFLRRQAREGARSTYVHFLKRCLALVLLGILVYHLTGNYSKWDDLTTSFTQDPGKFLLTTFKRMPFEALVHIAVTSLFVLPVIAAPGWVRVLFAAAAGGLHVWLSVDKGYYTWNMSSPVGIDGGPLGFLTWSIPLIAGTLAHDWVMSNSQPLLRSVFVGLLLMALGIVLAWRYNESATLPFIKPEGEPVRNYWLMSQRAGSVTYLLFGAGFGLLIYALFRIVCDHWGVRWGYLDLLGRHALWGYIIHDMVSGVVSPFVPKDSPAWWVGAAFLVYLGITSLFLWYLDRNKLALKL